MATFYSAASDPSTNSLNLAPYVQAETRLVDSASAAFTCSNCYAAARFHGFLKVTGGACSDIAVASLTGRTYVLGQIKVDAWATAAAGTVTGSTLNCVNGQYVEIFQEARRGTQASSHALSTLLPLNTGTIGTGNLYAAYAISNTPVPLTVTQ
jgi:hypothetical protein